MCCTRTRCFDAEELAGCAGFPQLAHLCRSVAMLRDAAQLTIHLRRVAKYGFAPIEPGLKITPP